MIKQIARISYKHRFKVIVVWVVLLSAVVLLAHRAGNGFTTQFTLPGTDSQAALNLLNNRFPNEAGSTGDIVFKASGGVYSTLNSADMQALFTKVSSLNQVVDVQSPYNTIEELNLVSPNQQIGYAVVHFNTIITGISNNTFNSIQDLVTQAGHQGLQIELGGDAFSSFRPQLTSIWVGVTAAIVILLIAFGSVIAMGLPVINALVGIGIGISLVELLAHVVSLPDFSTELGAMLGVGVGVDYALLIVTRYRQGISKNLNPEVAITTAVNTAGRSVFFAGTAVVISLLGMLLMNVGFIQGLGLASAVVVAITMLASITLLPAIISLVGAKIDLLKIPRFTKKTVRTDHLWYSWSRMLQKRPWPPLLLGLIILAVLAVPFFSIRLGSSDSSSEPTSDTTRRAYDLISQGFGVGANGPLLMAASISGPRDIAQLQNLVDALEQTPGVAYVSPLQPNSQFEAAIFQVIPTTSPENQATTKLINNIRNNIIPEFTAGSDISVHVGGITATYADLANRLQSRLPIFIFVVLAVSFALLLLVFRSIVIPIKAVIMNILSIGAAYGVLVAIFQWGWLRDLVGIGQAGPIDSYVPMIMFAILFGLSMDYEVFLLSRIKEEYNKTGDNSSAVADGLAKTARVISAAALIMVTVFASFILVNSRILKEFGLGLAVAILLDATIVRLVMVPAIMELLGKTNWWFPRWLDWLPAFHIESEDS